MTTSAVSEPSVRRGWRYRAKLVLIALVGVVLTVEIFGAVVGYREVDRILYPPRMAFCCDTPQDAGIAYEDVSLVTTDNVRLTGWYLLPRDTAQDAALIMAHGAGGNRASLWNLSLSLNEQGYGILLLDMRAHGESEGSIFTRGWLDIQAAVDYLVDRGITSIGSYGFSLGANMVIQAAAQTEQIGAVIADGASPVGLSDMPLPRSLWGWLYLSYDLVYWSQLEARSAADGGFAAMPMREAVARIAPRPLLLIAAGAEASGFEQSTAELLYEAAAEPKSLWIIDDVYHGGGFEAHPEVFTQTILDFVAAAFGEDPRE